MRAGGMSVWQFLRPGLPSAVVGIFSVTVYNPLAAQRPGQIRYNFLPKRSATKPICCARRAAGRGFGRTGWTGNRS